MFVSTTVPSQSSPLTSRLYASTTTNSSNNQWSQVANNNDAVLSSTSMPWTEMPSYKIIPVSNFVDSNGGYINSKMNVVSTTTSNLNDQMFNTPTYLLPTCERDVTNIPNRLCGHNEIRPPGLVNAPNATIPYQRNGSSGVYSNNSAWAANGVAERYTRPTVNPMKTTSGAVKKHKRVRTAFTSQQMMELEQEYARNRYLDRTRRIELADTLHLNERTIKIWFQNRRMKEKKDRAENYDDSEEPSTTDSSPDMVNKTMPILTQNQYAFQISNGVFNHESCYVGPYPVASSPMMMSQMNMTQEMRSSVLNSYPTFVLDNNMQLQEKFEPTPQSQLKMEDLEPICKTNVPESQQASPMYSDISAIDSAKSEVNDQSWDLSWIRNIHFEDEA
ncbi:unnamed protein product [Parnassius mnemosyne]|uniref:Homeobox domain-containing protein n=1 Tax=Parnassius mnemosyne TaxID=213953 RepID=A0AAV1KC44_9NEOP